MEHLTIIADDLTGANDTGVQFSQKGYSTMVVLDPEAVKSLSKNEAIWSINSDTRNLSIAQAYNVVYKLALSLREGWTKQIYKKIDSTMRGHPGAELEALMDVLEASLALVVPAFPGNRRTVHEGYVYVDSQKICHVPSILHNEMSRKIDLIGLDSIRAGIPYLKNKIIEANKENSVLVLDAVTEHDLETISLTVRELSGNIILAGSAGLANFLSSLQSEKTLDSQIPSKGAVLVIAGSHNPVTATQIEELAKHTGQRPIWINTGNIINGYSDVERDRALEKINQVADEPLIILAVDSLNSICTPLIPTDLSSIAAVLGDIVKTIVENIEIKALVTTGGDTSLHVCETLGVVGINLNKELLPGIPLGYLMGGIADGIPIITKAGGFGTRDSLLKVADLLTKKCEEGV